MLQGCKIYTLYVCILVSARAQSTIHNRVYIHKYSCYAVFVLPGSIFETLVESKIRNKREREGGEKTPTTHIPFDSDFNMRFWLFALFSFDFFCNVPKKNSTTTNDNGLTRIIMSETRKDKTTHQIDRTLDLVHHSFICVWVYGFLLFLVLLYFVRPFLVLLPIEMWPFFCCCTSLLVCQLNRLNDVLKYNYKFNSLSLSRFSIWRLLYSSFCHGVWNFYDETIHFFC